MPFCAVCKANKEPDDACKTHNKDSYTKCPYHPRFPDVAARKQPIPDSDTEDSDCDAELQSAIPKTPNKRSVASVASSGSSASDLSSITNAQLLAHLYDGKLSKQQCKRELTLRVEKADESNQVKILNLIKAVNEFVAEVGTKTEDVSEAAKEVANLQSKHGKLSGLYKRHTWLRA